jgi:hypothetical protein
VAVHAVTQHGVSQQQALRLPNADAESATTNQTISNTATEIATLRMVLSPSETDYRKRTNGANSPLLKHSLAFVALMRSAKCEAPLVEIFAGRKSPTIQG